MRRWHQEREGYVRADRDVPVHILETIVWQKEQEIQTDRDLSHLKSFPVRDLVGSLRRSSHQPALIAEVKRASPSRGILRQDFDAIAIAKAYEQGGAGAISVLTDRQFFQGSWENLALIREQVDLPLLCKEFIIDRVQLDWARAYGADGVLLIRAILSDRDLVDFYFYAQNLGMQVLIEVHTIEELNSVLALGDVVDSLKEGRGLMGVNNRNLRDFTVSLQTTIDVLSGMEQQLRESIFWVSESGLYTRSDLDVVQKAGAKAVLVGESLVKQPDIAQAVALLLHEPSH
ncbi:MAG: indole-3-glycerol phosphate synthase TrpC [Cyanobacteria bacterium KgW148]|nr:indole-3-glycerol phosphate synthase TrpC [Cyanobacteria bacterium KgW148]